MPRLTGLDALRGIAALMVFVHHVQVPGNPSAASGLDAGVLIFFALSGYLLYGPFAVARDSGKTIDLWVYAIRRAVRLLPAYIVASVLISAIWYPALLGDPVGLALGTRTPIVVVWTLRIEFAFYLLLPVIAWAIARVPHASRIRALLALAAASIAFTTAVMWSSVQATGIVRSTDLLSIAAMLWAFVPGMLVAELQQRGGLERSVPLVVPLAGLALIGLSVVVDLPPYLDVAAASGSGLLIATIVSRRHGAYRFGRTSAVLGALSYSVYLWHEAIIDLVDRPNPSWGGGMLALAISVAIASLVYVMGERPAIRLGHRLALARHRRLDTRARVADQDATPVIPITGLGALVQARVVPASSPRRPR